MKTEHKTVDENTGDEEGHHKSSLLTHHRTSYEKNNFWSQTTLMYGKITTQSRENI